MARVKVASALTAVCLFCVWANAQEKVVLLQSPRQAVIEMFTGGKDAFAKHFTLEMQQKLGSSAHHGQMSPEDLAGFADMATSAAGPNFQSFESGPILFSFENPKQQ